MKRLLSSIPVLTIPEQFCPATCQGSSNSSQHMLHHFMVTTPNLSNKGKPHSFFHRNGCGEGENTLGLTSSR